MIGGRPQPNLTQSSQTSLRGKMLVLELLGTLSLRNATPPVPVSAQQKRSLGLLAILALSGGQGFPRDRIEAYLWPESSAPLARHSLDQTVYAIRHALGSDFILSSGRELQLTPDLVQVHAWEFEPAIRPGRWAASHDRWASAETSHEAPSNGSSPLAIVAATVKGKAGGRRDGALLYAVIALAILMTAAASWGWMRPETSKPVSRFKLMVDSTESM